MKVTDQIAADRKTLLRTGWEVMAGGAITAATGIVSLYNGMPAGIPEVVAKSGIVAAGGLLMSKISLDFLRAARNTQDPIREVRRRLNQITPFPLIATATLTGSVAMATLDVSRELRADQSIRQGAPMADSRKPFERIVRTKDYTCPRGTAVITFDDERRTATIKECAAAPSR